MPLHFYDIHVTLYLSVIPRNMHQVFFFKYRRIFVRTGLIKPVSERKAGRSRMGREKMMQADCLFFLRVYSGGAPTDGQVRRTI